MADLVVIVPTRGRPHAVAELREAFAATCTARTELLLAVDDDDPERAKYSGWVIAGPNRTMVEALNTAACYVADLPFSETPFAVGFMGDDHRPRTKGWDKAYLDELRRLGTGIVYGDDLLQRERIPTQVAMTADIIRAVGHMAPPTLRHMYVDNYWKDLGTHAGCLRYLPDVVVEHMHPVAGKSEWTEGHVRVNQPSVYQQDARAYEAYVRSRLAADVEKVKALRSVAA